MSLKAVHYINQFYAGIGGETMADTGFGILEEKKGCREKVSEGSGTAASEDGGMPLKAAPCPEVICEKLVTEKMAKGYVESCCGETLRFAKGTSITPAARDIFRAGHKKTEIL